jgi:CDP-glucose 4,6-dehydratase
VIGGGDFAEARIIPDLVRAQMQDEPLLVRRPDATRPFQHVADVLRGYLMQAEHLAAGSAPPALNFGPRDGEIRVRDLLALWGDFPWRQDQGPVMAEAPRLALDSTLAGRAIGWHPLLDTPRAIAATAGWYAAWREGAEMARATDAEIVALLDARAAAA